MSVRRGPGGGTAVLDRTGPELVYAVVHAGFGHAEAGRLEEAEAVFRQALALDPLAADAYHGLGLLAFSVQKYDAAEELVGHALRLAPGSAPYLNALGRIHKACRRFERAESFYRRAIAADPRYVEPRISLGIVLREREAVEEAIDCYRDALKLAPAMVEAHVNLLNVLRIVRSVPRAREIYEPLIARSPETADLRYFYGTVLQEAGLTEEAQTQFEAAASADPTLRDELGDEVLPPHREKLRIALAYHHRVAAARPDAPEAHFNLGTTLRRWGDRMSALSALQRAVELQPDYYEATLELGRTMLDLRFLAQAVECVREAVELRSDDPAGHNALASALLEVNAVSEAIETCGRALELSPDHIEAHVVLGNCLIQQRRVDEAHEHYRLAVAKSAAGQSPAAALHNLLFTLNYSDRVTAAELFDEHRRFGLEYAPLPEPVPAHANPPDPERRLRIGYVSADFRSHAVALFFEPMLANHLRSETEVTCYSVFEGPDDHVTTRFRQQADEWVACGHLSDYDLAERIRADRIDILVDLNGHTGGSRLFLFGLKPAPVQMTMLGYPTTSGVPAVDYRITDWFVDPPGYEAFNVERPLRLPRSYYCYRPGLTLDIGPLPARAAGCVTFGSFNNIAKVSDAAIALWAEVLRAVPAATLVLKHKGFGDAGTQKQLLGRFAALGIAVERVRPIGWEERGDTHLDWYNRVDVALDSYPYNGATTTCEALWMGVPVVSLAGDTHASRMGLSILNAAGCPELVAHSREQFVAIARALATDPGRLERLRATLRERIAGSQLRDEVGYTRALEGLYRQAWREWCARRGG